MRSKNHREPEAGAASASPHKRTPKQLKALSDAYRVLSGNFDHVLIVASDAKDHAAMGADLEVCWAGGYMMANSQADFAKRRIEHRRIPNAAPQKV
jgi:hypothetical protein